MKVKVTLDNKWYHLDKIVNCIDGNELLGSIKKQANKRCITFSGRAKRVNDEWIFEPNPKGKNFHRFESAFTPKQKQSKLKLLTDDQVDTVFRLFKLNKRKRIPLPVKLSNGNIRNIWVNKFINENALRGYLCCYNKVNRVTYTITGLVIRDNSNNVVFIPYTGKHFNLFEQYLGCKIEPVMIDTLPFVKGASVGVEVKTGVIKYAKMVYNIDNYILCQLSFRFNNSRYLIDGFVNKGSNQFQPLEGNQPLQKIYNQYLESR